MLFHMANDTASFDSVFHALADQTRRAVIGRLLHGPASVTELASPFEMGLPAFLKHVRVLEESALIRSVKSGRVRTCHVQPERLSAVEGWLAEQRAIWAARADRLADYVENQIARENEK